MPDLVPPVTEIRYLHAGANTPAHKLGAFSKPPHRAGDRPGEQKRENDHHPSCNQKELEDRQTLTANHVVDVGALGRKHQGTAHRAEALHWNSDRDDHLTALVDAHHVRLEAFECPVHLLVSLAVLGTDLVIE